MAVFTGIKLEGLVKINGRPLSKCSTAIRRLISHSELAVECLDSIVDNIDRQVPFVVFSRVLGLSVQIGGGLLAVSEVKGLNFPYI